MNILYVSVHMLLRYFVYVCMRVCVLVAIACSQEV